MQIIFAIMICVSCAALSYSIADSMVRRRQIKERLQSIDVSDGGISLHELEMARPFAERVLQPVFTRLGALLGSVTPQSFLDRVERRLALAGYPRTEPMTFLGIKGLAALITGGAFVLFYVSARVGLGANADVVRRLPSFILLAPMLGFMAPDLWLRLKETERKTEISDSLPDLLDLLSVSVEAGLGFEQALMHAAEKLKGAVSLEIRRMLQDMRIGLKHSDALRAMSDRVDLPDMKIFCAALIQSYQLGVSIAEVLRVQSESMRQKRRQRAEEAAMKAPLKLLFPLVLFIFPSMLIIVWGPAMLKLMDALKSGM
jgi:tight adherence protein C